jgi:hypothetical protein
MLCLKSFRSLYLISNKQFCFQRSFAIKSYKKDYQDKRFSKDKQLPNDKFRNQRKMEISSKDSKRELEGSSETETAKRAKTDQQPRDENLETEKRKKIEDIVGIQLYRTSTPGNPKHQHSPTFKRLFCHS